MTIPGVILKTKHPRAVVMYGDCGEERLFWVEPMRFLYPSEAKNEAKARDPMRCAHRRLG